MIRVGTRAKSCKLRIVTIVNKMAMLSAMEWGNMDVTAPVSPKHKYHCVLCRKRIPLLILTLWLS